MSKETLYFIMYLLALLSVGIALFTIKDKKKRSIVLAPIVVAFAIRLGYGWLY